MLIYCDPAENKQKKAKQTKKTISKKLLVLTFGNFTTELCLGKILSYIFVQTKDVSYS